MGIKSCLKKIGILGLSAYMLNFGANTYLAKSINKKQEKIKTHISQIKEYNIEKSRLNNIITEIGYVDQKTNLLKPFWQANKTKKSLDDKLERMPSVLKKYAKRTMDIGLGLENKNQEEFAEELEEANIALGKYGIFLNINETVDVYLPDSYNTYNFAFGSKHSFNRPHDYYFVWTEGDYSEGENDYAAESMTEERVCLIDEDFKQKNLDKLITQEILRLFVGAENTTLQNDDKKYYTQIDDKIVERNLLKKFKDEPYKIDMDNFNKHRVITVNVGLDDVSEKFARDAISRASAIFTKDFNISFKPVAFYDHKLPESWSTYDEMEKVKNEALKQSDIYLLLTDHNWNDEDDDEEHSVLGETNWQYGYVWTEAYQDMDYVVKTILIHEFAHLFAMLHVYNEDAKMHPYESTNSIWMPKTKETIIKNKFKKWEWSKE